MADKIFGQGLDAVPLKLVQTPAVIPANAAQPRPVYIQGLGTAAAAAQAAAQANFAGADITALKVELNAFLAKLRTAGLIAT